MSKEVKDYILKYNIYQRAQIFRHHLYSKLLVLFILQRPMSELTINFIIGLPPTKTRTKKVANTILVIINKYKVFRILYCHNNNYSSRTGRPIFKIVALI